MTCQFIVLLFLLFSAVFLIIHCDEGVFIFEHKAVCGPDTELYDFGQRFHDWDTSLWLGLNPAVADKTSDAIGKPLIAMEGVTEDSERVNVVERKFVV